MDENTMKLWTFLGGSIGNFNRDEAVNFLRKIRGALTPGNFFIDVPITIYFCNVAMQRNDYYNIGIHTCIIITNVNT
jgi:uncharacterized SAM-dependent methyltransferase